MAQMVVVRVVSKRRVYLLQHRTRLFGKDVILATQSLRCPGEYWQPEAFKVLKTRRTTMSVTASAFRGKLYRRKRYLSCQHIPVLGWDFIEVDLVEIERRLCASVGIPASMMRVPT